MSISGYNPANHEPDRLERTDVGASVQVELTRGTGTRDQEKFRIKGKGENSYQAMMEFEQLLTKFEADWSERVRSIQPQEADEE